MSAPHSSIIDGRMFVRLDLDDPDGANRAFRSSALNKGSLVQQLLVYDQVVIPTVDFGIVPILIDWLGVHGLRSALESKAFRFLRRSNMLAYAGNGVGLSTVKVVPPANTPWRQWWQGAMWDPLEAALNTQLIHGSPTLDPDDRNILRTQILELSEEFLPDNEFFMKNIMAESYNDVIGSPELAELARHLAGKFETFNLASLPGINGSDVRVLRADGQLGDAVDLVLRIAEVNTELAMAALSDSCDLLTSAGADKLVESKISRAGAKKPVGEGFVTLVELNGLPDIATEVARDTVDVKDLWNVRQSAASRQFRHWLHTTDAKSAREFEQRYVESLKKLPFIDSGGSKAGRLLVSSVLGIINPIAGIIAGATDSFLVEKYLGGSRPRLFFDQLNHLMGPKQSS